MIHVRSYMPDDRVFVLKLAHRLAIGRQPYRDLESWLTAVEKWILESIHRNEDEGMIFIAEDRRGERIGFAAVSQCRHFTGQIQANIGELAVSESCEGNGVGTALLKACEEWAREKGNQILTLSTGAGNTRALQFYHHLGFLNEDIILTKLL